VLFADALGRDLMPAEFPEPARLAPEKYVRFVLASCGENSSSMRSRGEHAVAKAPKTSGRAHKQPHARRPPISRTFDRRRSESSAEAKPPLP
jgi:hypothetical protein